jgi:PKD repeat protein
MTGPRSNLFSPLSLFALLLAVLLPAAPASASHDPDFSCSPSCTVPAGQAITFTAQPGAKEETVELPYEWDLDGNKTTGNEGFETQTQGPTTEPRSYTTPGTYTIRLRVTADEFGNVHSAIEEREITITERPPPPAGTPLRASFTTAANRAGRPTRLDASRSTVPEGRRIISYLWDFNGDRRIDANTGTSPQAAFRFVSPGTRRVGLQVQDDSGAFSELVYESVTIAGIDRSLRCGSGRLALGFLEISASCIRHEGDRFIADLATGASINGVEVAAGPGAELILDTGGRQWTLSATGRIRVQLPNTPIGTITLFERDLRANPINLPIGGQRIERGAPGVLLGTFSVSHTCARGPRVVCAQLPGGFPLVGGVSLYLTPRPQAGFPAGMLVDANAELSRPFPVRGRVAIEANLDTGPQIDSFEFEVGRIDLGVARVNRLGLAYERRDDNGDLDVWEGGVDASLSTPTPAGLEGSFRFANGRFNRAAFDLRGVRVPVGPGIFLDSFGATLGVDPFRLGGRLGASFGPASARGQVDYEDTNPDHIGVGGDFSLLGAQLARARFDYWTNGDLEFLGEFHYGFPNRNAAIVLVDGGVRGWFQGSRGRFQVEGDVNVAVPILAGRAAVLLNNDWIAGCGEVRARNPFSRDPYATWGITLSGHLALRLRDGSLDAGFGSCDLGRFRIAGPRGAQAGGVRAVRLPEGLPGAELEIKSASGLPAVTVRGPGGETFTTPTTPAPPSRQGRFLQVGAAHEHELHVYIRRPRAGRWTITPAAGAPAITSVRQALQLPKPRVKARVIGRGRSRTLVYNMRRIAGQRVRFREDGADSNHVLGTARGRRGRIRFRPVDGRGRVRRIVADVIQDGRPRTTLVAGRYRAPRPFVPKRPGKVRARRSGARVILTWSRSRGARRYSIVVRGSDGRRRQFGTGRRRLVIAPVPPRVRLVATVRGEAKSGRAGPARRVKVRPAPARRRRR